jgi:hypothetical protein
MRLPGYLIGFVLAILLSSTTPVGTGGGVHRLALLHPLFGHIHIVNGRVLTHEQLAQQSADAPVGPGVNLGAGPGASADDGGLGVSPTLPAHSLSTVMVLPGAWLATEPLMPRGREDAPPDPPPL